METKPNFKTTFDIEIINFKWSSYSPCKKKYFMLVLSFSIPALYETSSTQVTSNSMTNGRFEN
jgi:hypothetical protein